MKLRANQLRAVNTTTNNFKSEYFMLLEQVNQGYH